MAVNASVIVVYESLLNEMKVVRLSLVFNAVCGFVTMRSHEGTLVSLMEILVTKFG